MESDRGYFVQLQAPPGAAGPGVPSAPPRGRRRRSGVRLRFPVVLLLVVGGWLAWAATTEGGISARVGDIVDTIRGKVESATANAGLKRAADYYNLAYAQRGSYPDLTETEAREDPDVDWGVGVDVRWCSGRAVVLSGLTGGGTRSRLLLDGQDLGDVQGRIGCPADLSDPDPWRLPEPES